MHISVNHNKVIYIFFFVVLLIISASCSTSKKVADKKKVYNTATEVVDELLNYKSNSHINTDKVKKIFKLNKNDNKILYGEVSKWLGTPYKFGGSSLKGTDCSGMVMQIYKNVYSLPLERNSAMMFEKNCKKISKNSLSEGDLVFFSTTKTKAKINHVGIYLKDGYFVHASSSKGVIISSLNEPYYTRAFITGGKVKGRK